MKKHPKRFKRGLKHYGFSALSVAGAGLFFEVDSFWVSYAGILAFVIGVDAIRALSYRDGRADEVNGLGYPIRQHVEVYDEHMDEWVKTKFKNVKERDKARFLIDGQVQVDENGQSEYKVHSVFKENGLWYIKHFANP